MSSDALPISPTAFAAALRELPISTLHLKAMELRNSIAHLDYSNEQLRPFANGTEPSTNGTPDADCVEAIRENEVVIARQTERIQLLKEEVERRGASWSEFRSKEEIDGEMVNGVGEEEGEGRQGVNVGDEREERSSAWTDGTFQTGRIVDGELRMDGDAQANGTAVNGTSNHTGGRLDDEALRRAMNERMRALAEEGDDDQGMHL
ncbi:uncharacterized protein RAG0_13870 [Rhynchosporium agropyri]|uniref:Secondary alcohol dehydrogenase n=1 Tax=Rhynchosporium agropyri TaxID=914238 RepID=A0A1E1LGT4_9HELO|nr:uncharacterized protein RAG0_13870 [Rhynchosporium agropyri]